MAEVTTTQTLEPVIAPFITRGNLRDQNSGIPWGQASHVSSFSVPAVGSGDTGKLLVYLNLPNNYWAELAAFHIDQRATSEPEWNAGVLRVNYTGENSLSPGYSSTDLYFPLATTGNASIGSDQYKTITVGNVSQEGANQGGMSVYDVNSPSKYLVKSKLHEPSGGIEEQPLVTMYNNTTGVHATVFKLAIVWKLYDLSQGNHPWLRTR